MKQFLRRFKRLQWKMAFSYALNTAIVLFILQIVLSAVAFLIINLLVPQLQLSAAQQKAQSATPYFVHNDQPDQEALGAWLMLHDTTLDYGFFSSVILTDRTGQVVASSLLRQQGLAGIPTNRPAFSLGVQLSKQLPEAAARSLNQVLAGRTHTQALLAALSDGSEVVIAPVVNARQQVVGGVMLRTIAHLSEQSNLYWVRIYLLLILVYLVLFSLFALLVGSITGFFAVRGFTRRFARLSSAVDNWSRGDFTVFARDTIDDEIGQLSQRLDRMAEQLQNLLQTRQKFAMLEERNRLARDLHDSVKQQIFAVSLQISTARALLRRDIDRAEQRLNEAERLVRQAQQELTSLILELRPTVLDGKGLAIALQDYVKQWSKQTEMPVDVEIQGNYSLPVVIEEELYRILQEALANVARHSSARSVSIKLQLDEEATTLSIADNGQGFLYASDAPPASDTIYERRGVGLDSMRERIEALDGELQIQSLPGQGTTITASCRPVAVMSE
jgi:NarL family two-component system sensor histidine kinase LiaS